MCHFGRYKGPKGLTDAIYECEKVEKTVSSCDLFKLNCALSAVKSDAKF